MWRAITRRDSADRHGTGVGWLQFDCGVHVGRSGDDRRPYLDSDEVDMEDIDILFIRCVRAWPQAAHEA